MSRFDDTSVITSAVQTHTDQLTGVAGRGLFVISTACRIVGFFATATASLQWNVFLELPNPANPASPVRYLWVNATAFTLLNNDQWVLPVGAKVVFTTNAVPGSNPTCQILTRAYMDRFV